MVALRSPGVVVREKDLTTGRADITSGNIAGFSAPFTRGPLEVAVNITRESELIEAFGEPTSANSKYFLSASNYLSYGGTLSVSRVNSSVLKNATARLGQSLDTVTLGTPGGKYIGSPNVTVSAPDLAGGVTAEVSAQINDATGAVEALEVTLAGSGYSSPPTITVDPVGNQATLNIVRGTQAVLTTIPGSGPGSVSGGAITLGTISAIDVPGSGYRDGANVPAVTITGGGGNDDATAVAVVTNGQITGIEITGGGTGYTGAYTVTIDAPEGVVVTVANEGTNYDPGTTYAVDVDISGGTENVAFAATATIGTGGVVSGLTVTEFGDYTSSGTLTATIPAPGTTATGTPVMKSEATLITNDAAYESAYASNNNSGFFFAARSAGKWGNNLRVCIVDHGPTQSLYFTSTLPTVNVGTIITQGSVKGKVIDTGIGTAGTILHVVILDSSDAYVASPTPSQKFVSGSQVTVNSVQYDLRSGNDAVDDGSAWYASKELYTGSNIKWNSIAARPLTTADAEGFSSAGENAKDAVHVAIVDEDGGITGAKNTIVETFTYLSKAKDARGPQGGSNYYKNFVSDSSAYVYAGDTVYNGYATAVRTSSFEPVGSKDYALTSGTDYNTVTGAENNGLFDVSVGELNAAYDLFADTETITVDYLIMGPGLFDENQTKQKASYIASIAKTRRDCIAVVSPHEGNILSTSGVPRTNQDIVSNIKNFYSTLGSNSYCVFDSNYKYVYDRWNDVYCYIPCNTDIAGLIADTSIRNEPWFSPAGLSRGGIRNIAKLAWNPTKADRDELYSNRINPIVSFPGQGAVLFGDKTALSNPSAFDRINVRKLFLVLEKAIEQAAKAQLFEINDETTRNVFRSIVEPFLRDVQARRGVTEFLVVCDDTNNTPAIIDNNEFVAEIYVKPARSINFITLTFTATRTGISFSEVTGR